MGASEFTSSGSKIEVVRMLLNVAAILLCFVGVTAFQPQFRPRTVSSVVFNNNVRRVSRVQLKTANEPTETERFEAFDIPSAPSPIKETMDEPEGFNISI